MTNEQRRAQAVERVVEAARKVYAEALHTEELCGLPFKEWQDGAAYIALGKALAQLDKAG